MDRKQIVATLLEIVTAVDARIDVAKMRIDETPFRAYGLTSLGQLEVSAQVTERFGISFEDSDILLAVSPLGLVTLIEHRLADPA